MISPGKWQGAASHDQNKQTKKANQKTKENFGDKSVLGKRKSKYKGPEVRNGLAGI